MDICWSIPLQRFCLDETTTISKWCFHKYTNSPICIKSENTKQRLDIHVSGLFLYTAIEKSAIKMRNNTESKEKR